MSPPDEDVIVNYEKMNLKVWGFVYVDSNSIIHIIINDRLVPEIQQRVYLHELHHIQNDFNRASRLIGLDCQHEYFENVASLAARIAAARDKG